MTTKRVLKSFQVSCHPFPAVLQDSPWKTALSTPVLEMSVVRSWGAGCQRRGRVSRPFSPIREGEAATSPAFCRNEGGCVGLVRLSDGGGELEELGGSCRSPAVRRGRICSRAQLAPQLAPSARLAATPRCWGRDGGARGWSPAFGSHGGALRSPHMPCLSQPCPLLSSGVPLPTALLLVSPVTSVND